MKRLNESEKEKLKNILLTYDENSPVYIKAKRRWEYEIQCIKEEQKQILLEQIDLAKKIIKYFDDESRRNLALNIKKAKMNGEDNWQDEFEKRYPETGVAMAIAYEELFGPVR